MAAAVRDRLGFFDDSGSNVSEHQEMICKSLFERRSFENPQTPISSPTTWLQMLAGGPTESGMNVSESKALTFGPVLAAVRVLAESLAVLPVIVYERSDRSKEKRIDHPAYRLVHDAPNQDSTAVAFKELIQGHIALWGNGYARIERNRRGEATALIPLLPDRTWPQRISGRVVYHTRLNDGSKETLLSEEVLHVPGLGFDGLRGHSPVSLARQAIGLGLSAETFNSKIFANGGWLGGVLEHPGELSKQAAEHLRGSWTDTHGGVSNAWKPAILEEGMKWNQVSIPAKDALFLQLRQYQVTEIARMYRVPPHMIGDLERATFSNIEQMSLEFVKYSLAIWISKWEQELTRKLFVGQERGRLFAEFNLNAFLRGDATSRFNSYKQGRDGGWLSINDVRELENMNPIEGGDEYMQPLNMVSVGSDEQDLDEQEEDEGRSFKPVDIADALEPVLLDAAARVVRRECDRIRRAASRRTGVGNAIAKLYREHQEYMLDCLLTPAMAMASAVSLRLSGPTTRSDEARIQAIIVGICTDECRAGEDTVNGAIVCGSLDKTLEQWDVSRPEAITHRIRDAIIASPDLKTESRHEDHTPKPAA